MKQRMIVHVIVLVIGLGIGIGAGVLVTQSKLEKQNKAIAADWQSKMQESEAISQSRIKSADAKVMRLSQELTQAKSAIEQLKSESAGTEIAAPVGEDAGTEPVVSTPSNNTGKIATKVYVVKDGDSLWEIAASQLGNGDRYKEILKLNPNISANGNLAIGAKLNIPSQ